MPGENIQDWSTTAANNATADSSINWAEGQARASVNDSARSMMAAVAKVRNLQNGSITTGGTANAQTFTSGLSYTSVPTGLCVRLKIGPGLTNTGTTTLNMDGIGGATIVNRAGGNLSGGELVAGAYVDLIYNSNWVLINSHRVVVQTFTANGTYTPTTGMTHCVLECVGGGGAGGGAAGASSYLLAGGGGGAGGYSRKLATAADIGASQAVTVGAGGTGSAGGAGGNGAATSVGSLCIANGGTGANAATTAQVPNAGAGAVRTSGAGDVIAGGAPGTPGILISVGASGVAPGMYGGSGGSSQLGGGGIGGAIGNAGGVAIHYGSGGGGASANSAGNLAGGDGASGIVFITEFINF